MLTQEISSTKLSAEVEEGELTAIHFLTRPSRLYQNGWWVSVNPGIFISPSGTGIQLGLVYAFGIPMTPDRHYFKGFEDNLRFTLFFPAIPKSTTHIDIIEKAGGHTDLYFNYYGVSIEKIRYSILIH